jgi:hypothetical protein
LNSITEGKGAGAGAGDPSNRSGLGPVSGPDPEQFAPNAAADQFPDRR